ncbi:miraculin-like [Populus alba x Populus x berolinensis]|nr:miraculin-like [Populus alba x Populus x berolinensis]
MTSIGATLSFVWLTMAICSLAQPADDQSPPVLDTSGQPLETGVEYYILPGITDVAGGLTLVNRNGIRCPFYVGQEPLASAEPNGTSVIFTPFTSGETIIRESRDLSVEFQAFTICIQSTAWRVGEEDPETGRRFIVTAGDKSYFRIDNNGGVYNFSWCPTESCPTCDRPRCGSAGILIEDDKRLLALDGPAFPFVFTRA